MSTGVERRGSKPDCGPDKGLLDRLPRPLLRYPPPELLMLVLVGLVAGLAIGLLFSSKASNGATILAGVLVAVGTYRTIQVTRRGQITERLSTAVEHLAAHTGAQPDETRVLGGIYALESIAKESDIDYVAVMEILTAYVRTRMKLRDPKPAREEFPNDVQAAVAVLGRRTEPPAKSPALDLRNTDLRLAKLPKGALLRSVNLSGADLSDAKLPYADLTGANLTNATLTGAVLAGAQLDGVHLAQAKGYDGKDTRGIPHCLPTQRCEVHDVGVGAQQGASAHVGAIHDPGRRP